MSKIVVFINFAGTLVKADGSEIVGSYFFPKCFKDPTDLMYSDMKASETVQKYFKIEFESPNRESPLLIQPKAIQFIHEMLKIEECQLVIVSHIRTDFVKELLKFQNISAEEMNKLTILNGSTTSKSSRVNNYLEADRNFKLKSIYFYESNHMALMNMAKVAERYVDSADIFSNFDLKGNVDWDEEFRKFKVIVQDLKKQEEISINTVTKSNPNSVIYPQTYNPQKFAPTSTYGSILDDNTRPHMSHSQVYYPHTYNAQQSFLSYGNFSQINAQPMQSSDPWSGFKSYSSFTHSSSSSDDEKSSIASFFKDKKPNLNEIKKLFITNTYNQSKGYNVTWDLQRFAEDQDTFGSVLYEKMEEADKIVSSITSSPQFGSNQSVGRAESNNQRGKYRVIIELNYFHESTLHFQNLIIDFLNEECNAPREFWKKIKSTNCLKSWALIKEGFITLAVPMKKNESVSENMILSAIIKKCEQIEKKYDKPFKISGGKTQDLYFLYFENKDLKYLLEIAKDYRAMKQTNSSVIRNSNAFFDFKHSQDMSASVLEGIKSLDLKSGSS